MKEQTILPEDIEERLNSPDPERDYWVEWVNASALVGEWDSQIEALRDKGYLNGDYDLTNTQS